MNVRLALTAVLAAAALGGCTIPMFPFNLIAPAPQGGGALRVGPTVEGADLLRPPGVALYRLTVDSDEGRGPQTLTADFELATADDAAERVTLLDVRRGPRGGALEPIASESWRASFGGDAEDGGALARFDVPSGPALGDLVPPDVPEPVFGAVADFVSFLSVQTTGFGADRLRARGDEHRFDAFEETWRRPPHLLDARIECPGGTLALAELESARAVVAWRPDPMALGLVRRPDAAAAAGLLLHGTETLELELLCDPRDGALLSGRSVRDDLGMRLWMNFPGTTVPPADALPPGPGMAVTIRRELRLVRLP